jgi:hypothetical protein
MTNKINKSRTHGTQSKRDVDSSDVFNTVKKNRRLLLAGAVGLAAVVSGVTYVNSRLSENGKILDRYQLEDEQLLDPEFNGMTDQELIKAGYTVVRAQDGEVLSELGQRVSEQLGLDSEIAIKLVRDQGITRDGNPAFGAGERFIFEGTPEQPQP